MRAPLTYARVDGPPRDWWNMRVWDRDRGAYVSEVIEVDTVRGFVVRYSTGPGGRPVIAPSGDEYLRVQVSGRFAIDRPGEVRSELWTGHDGRSPLQVGFDWLLELIVRARRRELEELAYLNAGLEGY